MTGDVLSWGDERPPGRPRGTWIGVVAVLALLGVLALARAGGPRGTAAPSPSPSTTSPAPVLTREPPPAEDAEFVGSTVVRAPARRTVAPVLFAHDLPGFVAAVDPNVVAVTAAGGPEHAEVLVGWCPSSRIFQDATGTYRYGAGGAPFGDYPPLPTHAVRPHAGAGNLVDVAAGDFRTGFLPGRPKESFGPPACKSADELLWPPLPERAATVDQSSPDARRVRGRYVVTTDTQAFCPTTTTDSRCGAGGWEVNALPSLPLGDLAGEYVWEGEFVVQANGENGTFRAIRLPEARLVRRARVGASAVNGVGLAVRGTGAGARLRFRPYGDGGPGPRPPKPDRDYALRPDVEMFLGGGRTGLGQPRPTVETLRQFLADRTRIREPAALWLVLDRAGRVLRIVAEQEQVVLLGDEVITPY